MPHGPYEREIAGVRKARAADMNAVYAALENTYTRAEGVRRYSPIARIGSATDLTRALSLDATGASDISTDVQAYLNANGAGHYRFDGGSFQIAQQITWPSGTVLEVDPRRTEFVVPTGVRPFVAEGELGTVQSLTGDVDEGSNTLSIASSTGIESGTWLFLEDDRRQINPGVAVSQEMVRVRAVSGAGPYTLELYEGVVRDYTTANAARVAPITPTAVKLFGLRVRFTGDGANTRGIVLRYGVGCEVDIPDVTGYGQNALTLETVAQSLIDRPQYREPVDPTSNGYGVLITAGSMHNRIRDGVGWHTRHDVVLGGGASHNLMERMESHGAFSSAFDTHGQGCRHNRYRQSIARRPRANGFVFGNTSYGSDIGNETIDCEVYDSGANAFQAHVGSHRSRFVRGIGHRCEQRGAFINDSDDCVIDHPDFIAEVLDGSLIRNSNGAAVAGGRITASGGHAILTDGTSDYARIIGVDARDNGDPADDDIVSIGPNDIVVYNQGQYTTKGVA